MEEKILSFIEDAKTLSNERFEIVSILRDLFLQSDFGFEEGFKYGGVTYNLLGKLIGGIYSYKNHVSIEFSHGANFPDPSNILEGNGKHRRHIKVKEIADIESKRVAFYIQQAANDRFP